MDFFGTLINAPLHPVISLHYVIVISVTDDLGILVVQLQTRVSQLEKGSTASTPAAKPPAAKGILINVVDEDGADDDFHLCDRFGSEDKEGSTAITHAARPLAAKGGLN